MTVHVSSTCAHHQEVKIALHSRHYTYRCGSMLSQHLVCKNELNCEYCNIALAGNNKAP